MKYYQERFPIHFSMLTSQERLPREVPETYFQYSFPKICPREVPKSVSARVPQEYFRKELAKIVLQERIPRESPK